LEGNIQKRLFFNNLGLVFFNEIELNNLKRLLLDPWSITPTTRRGGRPQARWIIALAAKSLPIKKLKNAYTLLDHYHPPNHYPTLFLKNITKRKDIENIAKFYEGDRNLSDNHFNNQLNKKIDESYKKCIVM